jgi:hypothetical protein
MPKIRITSAPSRRMGAHKYRAIDAPLALAPRVQ